jgi:hypothetical protein
MEWVLRLVGICVDDQSRSFDVMEISRPDGVGDIANLGDQAREGGLTLAEGKLLLAGVLTPGFGMVSPSHGEQKRQGATVSRGYRTHEFAVATGARSADNWRKFKAACAASVLISLFDPGCTLGSARLPVT